MPDEPTLDHVVVLTSLADDGSGHGRVWYVDELTLRRVEAELPEQCDESALYTEGDAERAREYREKLLIIDHTSGADS